MPATDDAEEAHLIVSKSPACDGATGKSDGVDVGNRRDRSVASGCGIAP
jgi:hypothetical protein